MDSGRWTLGTGPWTLDLGLWTWDSGRWTLPLKARLWALEAVVEWFRTESEPSF